MKSPNMAVCAITAGLLVLAAACQQSETGKSYSKWHLAPAPSSAPGYGVPLLPPDAEGKTSPAATTNGDDAGPSPTVTSESSGQQPSSGDNGSQTSTPILKIEPPPSAGGYGSQTSTPTWKIEPPPSPAGGYGK
jgi:hypothetical protein